MRVARPVRRAGRRNPSFERRQGAPARPYTYIPVQRGFLYLVAIMDWASRYVLAWRLSNTLNASFCTDALEEALARHGAPEIFNTDQGSWSVRRRRSDTPRPGR